MDVHTHTLTYSLSWICTHRDIHTHTNTHMHMYTHTHMCSASRVEASSWPQWAAACRGVQPSMSRASTSIPHCSRTLHTSARTHTHTHTPMKTEDLLDLRLV